MLNIAHRGASGLAPEHTFAAYDRAVELKADYIEQDLQQTSDGTLVVLHDETLDRTARPTKDSKPTDCTGPVRAHTLAEIKTCDVGTWFNEANPDRARPEFVDLRIPTLREVFERYGKDVNYYIETKSPAAADRMEERLLDLMAEFGLRTPAAERWQVLIQSFAPESLAKVHALDPSLPLVQLYFGNKQTSAAIQATLDAAREYAVGIGPPKDSTDRALVEAASARCLAVHPYTVNEEPEMSALIGLGVDGMFTKFPDRLEEVLGARAREAFEAAAEAARDSRQCRGLPEPGGTAAGSGEASTGGNETQRGGGQAQDSSSSAPEGDSTSGTPPAARGVLAERVVQRKLGLSVRGVPRSCASSFVARLRLGEGGGGSIRAYLDGRRVAHSRRSSLRLRVNCARLGTGSHRLRLLGVTRGERVARTVRFRVARSRGR